MPLDDFVTEEENFVIRTLMKKPRITMYALGKEPFSFDKKRETYQMLPSASLHFVVHELLRRNLVQALDTRLWRTGAPRRELALTFLGCITVLAELERMKKRERKIVQSLTETYGPILSYEVFKEFPKIDEALDGQGPEAFCSFARLMLKSPPYCEWNSLTFEQRPATEDWKRTHPSKKKQRKHSQTDEEKWDEMNEKEQEEQESSLKKQQEIVWRDEFALQLLHNIPSTHTVWSPHLNSLYREIIQKQIDNLEAEKKRKENLLDEINRRFHASEKSDASRNVRPTNGIPQ
jgi:hypothetical protein